MQNKTVREQSEEAVMLGKAFGDGEGDGILGDDCVSGARCTEGDSEWRPHGEKPGDKAFEELARRYESAIRATVASFNVPRSEREDLYQEGLIALYRAVCNYDESIARFSTFASVCIRRAMLTWIRDHVSKTDADGNRITEIPIDEVFGADFPEDAETPEELFISKERLSILKRNALGCLSDYEKCVFLMYLDNMTASEIGSSLGKSRKSVENALSRIRKKVTSSTGTADTEEKGSHGADV